MEYRGSRGSARVGDGRSVLGEALELIVERPGADPELLRCSLAIAGVALQRRHDRIPLQGRERPRWRTLRVDGRRRGRASQEGQVVYVFDAYVLPLGQDGGALQAIGELTDVSGPIAPLQRCDGVFVQEQLWSR